jgi:hypothetical protein
MRSGLAFDSDPSMVTQYWDVYSSVYTGSFEIFPEIKLPSNNPLVTMFQKDTLLLIDFCLCNNILLSEVYKLNQKVLQIFWDSQDCPQTPGAELIVQGSVISSCFGKKYFLAEQEADLMNRFSLSSLTFSHNHLFWVSLLKLLKFHCNLLLIQMVVFKVGTMSMIKN